MDDIERFSSIVAEGCLTAAASVSSSSCECDVVLASLIKGSS
jgi:hypothetical protein